MLILSLTIYYISDIDSMCVNSIPIVILLWCLVVLLLQRVCVYTCEKCLGLSWSISLGPINYGHGRTVCDNPGHLPYMCILVICMCVYIGDSCY